MKIRTAASFVLAASITWLVIMAYHEWYRYGFSNEVPDFRFVGHAALRFLSGLLFLFVGISYRKRPDGSGGRKVTGALLALCGALMTGMEVYEVAVVNDAVYDTLSRLDYWLSRCYMFLLAVSFLGFGFGLAGGNERNFRRSLLLLMLGSIGRLILGGFILYHDFSRYGLNTDTTAGLVMDVLHVVRYVFPLAILLFAWTIYRKKDLSETPLDVFAGTEP